MKGFSRATGDGYVFMIAEDFGQLKGEALGELPNPKGDWYVKATRACIESYAKELRTDQDLAEYTVALQLANEQLQAMRNRGASYTPFGMRTYNWRREFERIQKIAKGR